MAMYMFGANYGGLDVSNQFISCSGAFIGYDEQEAKPLHHMMSKIEIGDMIVIKAYSPSNGLYIKAIGLCDSEEILNLPKLDKGRSVNWIWTGNENLGIFKDCFTHFRTGTIYSEQNFNIQKTILKFLSTKISK